MSKYPCVSDIDELDAQNATERGAGGNIVPLKKEYANNTSMDENLRPPSPVQMTVAEPNTVQKRKVGRPRKLLEGEEGKTLSGHFSAAIAKRIAVHAAIEGLSISEWMKQAAEERLERRAPQINLENII